MLRGFVGRINSLGMGIEPLEGQVASTESAGDERWQDASREGTEGRGAGEFGARDGHPAWGMGEALGRGKRGLWAAVGGPGLAGR